MERRTRTYRGISLRAAIHYLEGLEGDQVDDTTVEGDGWTAELTADKAEVGPTLTLNQVTVEFEGDSTILEPLVEAFSQKAIRAGG